MSHCKVVCTLPCPQGQIELHKGKDGVFHLHPVQSGVVNSSSILITQTIREDAALAAFLYGYTAWESGRVKEKYAKADKALQTPVSDSTGASGQPQAVFPVVKPKVSLNDIVQQFDKPIRIAAQQLQVCPTLLKKICRGYGISRWPYRKVHSIDCVIARLEALMLESRGSCKEVELACNFESKVMELKRERSLLFKV